MSNRRALLVVAAIAVTTFFLFWLWPATMPGQSDFSATAPTGDQQNSHNAELDDSASQIDEAGMSIQQRRQQRLLAMQELLQAGLAEPGNLMATIQQLRQQCLPDEDCAALIDQALAEFPDADFARLVANAISRLPLYEAAMQETLMSMATPARERYATIQALREQTLGVEETKALFGQEAAWAEYQFRFGELMSDPALASMPADQRLAALQALRQSTLAEYPEALSTVEGDSGRYERELALLSAGVTDAAALADITRELRLSYFGPEQTAAMEARDQVVNEQQQSVSDYQQAVKQLDEELMPLKAQLPVSEWSQLYEQRLTELRLQYFP
ncbi:lipase chaperone [Alcanivorax sp. 1008]|uniref:lipase chaperone n=1 Tax=Alcanivorax sp. 1008 TaxID=2816853 RepID=UPI001DEA9827|nr:lipase chaperone [Alcanivorax sp. 1008]MCC1495473.1 hypothetical protein [Alcanivorax sp. 1008]